MSVADTFLQFTAAINNHDVALLVSPMSADHRFIDSLGNRVQGRSAMAAGWRAYFAMCPDYWLRADHVLAEGEVVLAAGEAGGTIDDTPCAYRRRGKPS